MTHEETKAWLAGLKAGDEVAIDQSRYSERIYSSRAIVRRTPGGRIVLTGLGPKGEHHRMFGADGWQIGDSVGPNRDRIVPLTDDVRAVGHRREVLEAVKAIRWTDQPTDVLDVVLAAVTAAKGKAKP